MADVRAEAFRESLLASGECGQLIASRDWSETALGPLQAWPSSLRTATSVLLRSPVPIVMLWGEDGVMLYNDAYSIFAGGRHPQLLGSKVREGWPEVADFNDNVMKVGLAGGTLAYRDQELILYRQGSPEQVFMNLDYSPVLDENGRPAGVLAIVVETTHRLLAERRLASERERLVQMYEQAPGFIAMLEGPDHVFTHANAAYRTLVGNRNLTGLPARQALPEVEEQGFFELLDRVYASGELFRGDAIPVRLARAQGHSAEERFVDFIYQPVADTAGRVAGIFVEGYDVTDRVRAQHASRESETRYRTLFEAIEAGFCIVEVIFDDSDRPVDYRFIETNPAFERQTGLKDAVGRTARELVPSLEEHWFEAYGRVALTGEPVRFESGSDAMGRWFDVHALRVGAPGARRVAILFNDITERRRGELALAESEARFRLMADAVPQIVWITDAEGRVEFFNKHWSDYTGAVYEPTTAAEIAAAHVHPDDGAATMAAFNEARRTGTTFLVEHRIRSGSGDYRWFLVRGEPYRDDPAAGAVVRWFGASVDIHDRKLAEARLHELNTTLEERVAERTAERNMLATLVETTDVMIMAADLNYNILAINAANADEFERIFGVRPKAGDNMLDLLAGQPEHQEQVRVGWERGLRGEHVTFVEDFGDPDRVRPYYEVKFRPLKNDTGELIGAYQFVTDVTDRLRKEAQLTEAQEALRQSQKMEAMGQLTGGVAHDFNNLLTPIVGALDMLQRKGLGGEREQRLIAGAAQSAERAKTLVQRLLAFARRQPLQPLPVDITKLVTGMADLVASTTGPQIKVVVEAADDLPPARADPNQLEMALLNLSVNARDAMPEGGTLRITASAESVRPGHRSRLSTGDYILLSVADTGVGMNKGTLARAVEPFFSTKGVGRGTGLGLSMVHGLASQLGGALTIQSRPGLGTNVELWVPQTTAMPDDSSVGSAPAPEMPGKGTALLVDDEELVRISTADMLSDLGYKVAEAASAEEAIGRLDRGERFDLLVTDHLMPGMTGTDLARALRSMRPDMPVLLVSGYAERDGIDPDLPRLTKPFRKDELATSLAQLSTTS